MNYKEVISFLLIALLLILPIQSQILRSELPRSFSDTIRQSQQGQLGQGQGQGQGQGSNGSDIPPGQLKKLLVDAPGKSCKGRNEQKCVLSPQRIGRKATAADEQQVRQIWKGLQKKTKAQAEAEIQMREDDKLNLFNLSDEQKRSYKSKGEGNKGGQRPTEIPNGPRRNLISTNNQYSNVDQGNIMAYEGEYIYIAQSGKFRIIHAMGTTLDQVHVQDLPFGTFPQGLVVHNGRVGLILQSWLTSKVIVRIYQDTGLGAFIIRSFEREGYYVQSAQMNGKLSLIVEDYTITDLSWDISGLGSEFAFIDSCGAWNPGANYVRNFATIDLANPNSFQLYTYLGCDYTLTASLAPSGKWYVASYYYDPFSSVYNMIVQRTQFNSLVSPANWAALYNTFFYSSNRMDEVAGCNLRIAAEGNAFFSYRLRLFSLGCTSFAVEIDSGLIGPNKSVISARWVGYSVYVSFYGSLGQIARLNQNPGFFTYMGSANHPANIFSLYEYGPSNIIGMGLTYQSFPNNSHITVNLYQTSGPGPISLVKNFNLNPNPSYAYSISLWEWASQYLHVDFINRKVVFSIYSTLNQPFSKGFYYVHVQPTPACILYPPINLCTTTGTASSSTYPLSPRVWKHWDNFGGYNWSTGASEEMIRTATIKPAGDPLSYLYTMSACQLQARIHPTIPLSPGLPLTPLTAPSFFDLCGP